MIPRSLKELEARLTLFLEELLQPMGRTERRHGARLYVEGLLLDGERKPIEPMASRIPGADVQALRQFVGQSPWAVEEVQRRLAQKVGNLLSDAAVRSVDETLFPKAGQHSVGVARQYSGALGGIANCQVAVSLHWSSAETSCPLLWWLYLPKEWLEDGERAEEGKLTPRTVYRTKTVLALEEIDQALAWSLQSLPVVADMAYGNDFSFRQALRERHLLGALGPPKSLEKVAQTLSCSAWRGVTWRQGSRGTQRSRFVMRPVWAAHGWSEQAHPPRLMEWPLVEWSDSEKQPTKYRLAQLGSETLGIGRFVRIAKARWRVEQGYRELKEELGLDHYEGRQWLGWHHHVCLVTMADAFLRFEQTRLKKTLWCDLEPAASPSAASRPAH